MPDPHKEQWRLENTQRIYLRLFCKADADIIAKLETVANKTDYIRQLIRADIAPSRENAQTE